VRTVFEADVVSVAVDGFDVGVRLGAWVFVGVCVGVVRVAVVEAESAVQVIINCGDRVILFSWV